VSWWYPYAGGVLFVLGSAVALFLAIDSRDSSLRKATDHYIASLDHDIRFLLLDTTGKRVAQWQLGFGLAFLIGAFWLGILILLLPFVAIGPRWWFKRARRQRVERIEKQLDGWLLMLSNMLKATGSLGDAIRATADLVHGPIGEEIDLVLKEVRLGASVDQALAAMAARVNSRVLSANVATLVVGRTTGGELPALLEQSAASLREMARLEGVVRTQTAQGKAQLLVLVGAPMVLVAAFHAVDPGFFNPLLQTAIGMVVLVTAVSLWVGAIFWARKVLNVDL